MPPKPPVDYPTRLIQEGTIAGQLLQQSLDEEPPFPHESACYYGLVEKRRATEKPWGKWLTTATAVAVVCSVGMIWLVRRGEGPARLTARPDATVMARTPKNVSPESREHAPAATATPKLQRSAPAKLESKSAPSAEPLNSTSNAGPEPKLDTGACATMAREGKLEQAASCYDEIGHGNSIASELALYEKARLESRALGRGAAALDTLDEHARRFPHGALVAEAGLTRIELLTRLGRADAALQAIELALTSSMGKERGGDLQLLKGDLLSKRGDCQHALSAYDAARAAGIHPSRMKAGEQRCARPSDVPKANDGNPMGTSDENTND